MDMTGAEIKAGSRRGSGLCAAQPDGSDGAYPYAAGLRWHVDASKPAGSRLSNMEFKGRNDSSWSATR